LDIHNAARNGWPEDCAFRQIKPEGNLSHIFNQSVAWTGNELLNRDAAKNSALSSQNIKEEVPCQKAFRVGCNIGTSRIHKAYISWCPVEQSCHNQNHGKYSGQKYVSSFQFDAIILTYLYIHSMPLSRGISTAIISKDLDATDTPTLSSGRYSARLAHAHRAEREGSRQSHLTLDRNISLVNSNPAKDHAPQRRAILRIQKEPLQ